MICEKEFYKYLSSKGICFWSGVPDSILDKLIMWAEKKGNSMTAANEGNAVGLASGYYLSTGKPACVFMQNSGLGNALNPLLSLCDESVYNIPLLLLIGWRGKPETKDEPQHFKEGLLTTSLLEQMGIKYCLLDKNKINACELDEILSMVTKQKKIGAILVEKGTFEKSEKIVSLFSSEFSRREALELIFRHLDMNSRVITSTGMISREWYDIREKYSGNHENDFLNVGAMGHELQIALVIAAVNTDKEIFCIEGDGACLMHMGGMAVVGKKKLDNFTHIVIRNGLHESIGGSMIAAPHIDFLNIAKGCGYQNVYSISKKEALVDFFRRRGEISGPVFVQLDVNCVLDETVGRPNELEELGKKFIENLC